MLNVILFCIMLFCSMQDLYYMCLVFLFFVIKKKLFIFRFGKKCVNTRKCKRFSDEIYKVSRSKYNSRGGARYLIVTVIILFLSDASCPRCRCRSRLKPKIDVEGKIKVVKFLVSINARRVHISAYVASAAYVSAAEVLSFRSYSCCELVEDDFFPGAKQFPCRSFF